MAGTNQDFLDQLSALSESEDPGAVQAPVATSTTQPDKVKALGRRLKVEDIAIPAIGALMAGSSRNNAVNTAPIFQAGHAMQAEDKAQLMIDKSQQANRLKEFAYGGPTPPELQPGEQKFKAMYKRLYPDSPDEEADYMFRNPTVYGQVLQKQHGLGNSETDKAARDWERVKSGDMTEEDYFIIHPNAFTPYTTMNPNGLQKILDKAKGLSVARTQGALDVNTSPEATQKQAKSEATIAGAKAAATATVGEQAKLQTEYASLPAEARPTKEVTAADADKLSLKAQGLDGASEFLRLLKSGQVKPQDITPLGQFTNPEVNQAYQNAIESLARMNTGAAFTSMEDKRFATELGSWKNLLTEKGVASVKRGMEQFIRRNMGSGRTTWGNDGWLDNFGINRDKLMQSLANPKSYSSEEEARKDGHKNGETVTINGVEGVLE